MKNVLPILFLALLGAACRSVEPSADPYFHDGVYALHDGGHEWIEESETESDSTYYDDYVIEYVPGEAAISPYNSQPTYMGYYGSDLYQNSYYNDTYWNGGYSSPFYSPFGMNQNTHCGMGWNWNFLFGSSFYPYYYNPYPYYGYGSYYPVIWSDQQFNYNAPRNHHLYGYSTPSDGGGTQNPGVGNHGRLRTMVFESDAQNVQRTDRGFGAWIERMAEAQPSSLRRDGSAVKKERTGFKNFVRDVSRGIEEMQGSYSGRDTDERPSNGKNPKVGSSGSSPSKGRSGSSGRSGGGSRGGSKGGGGKR